MIRVNEYTLAQVASNVCEVMLGLSFSPVLVRIADNHRLVASVQISGESFARVEIETVRDVARCIASRMFSTEPEALDEADLRDALGEVVNMVGGNLKGILSGEFDLSLPTIEDREMPIPKSKDAVAVGVTCEGFPFVVRVVTSRSTTISA